MSDPRLGAVLALLAQHEPVDERERTSRDQILTVAPTLLEPFAEEAATTHLTASAFILGERGMILHRHRRLGIWVQPGGHVDGGEEPAAAALREATEETGLHLDHAEVEPALVHVDVHAGPRGHTHLDLRYLLLADTRDPAPPAGESQEVRWVTFAQARSLADPGLQGAIGMLEEAWRRNGDRWRAKVER